jgi:hypothetical protein
MTRCQSSFQEVDTLLGWESFINSTARSVHIPCLDISLKSRIENAPPTQLQRGLLSQHDNLSSSRLAGARGPLHRIPTSFCDVPSGHDIVDNL